MERVKSPTQKRERKKGKKERWARPLKREREKMEPKNAEQRSAAKRTSHHPAWSPHHPWTLCSQRRRKFKCRSLWGFLIVFRRENGDRRHYGAFGIINGHVILPFQCGHLGTTIVRASRCVRVRLPACVWLCPVCIYTDAHGEALAPSSYQHMAFTSQRGPFFGQDYSPAITSWRENRPPVVVTRGGFSGSLGTSPHSTVDANMTS